jgi:hypothetical protein
MTVKYSLPVSGQIVPVQPLSATLFYMDTKVQSKSKRGRPSSMQRFKIKYTNTKGVIKTRNIKATSESRAMSEIKDMAEHHYTITESLDDPQSLKDMLEKKREALKESVIYEKWKPIIKDVAQDFSEEIQKMLEKDAEKHAQQNYLTTSDTPNDCSNVLLPAAIKVSIKVSARLFSHDLIPLKDVGYYTELTKEDWDAQNDSYDSQN